jgi:hypothetical protein
MLAAQRARYAQEQALYNQGQGQYRGACGGPSRQRYGPPAGDPYMYGPQYGSGYGYGNGYGGRGYGGGFGGGRQRNTGGALPLLGALAGGLLLGDLLF